MREGFNFEDIEYLRDYFLPKVETGTTLPNAKDVVDGTEFILNESGTLTPHKMINGKWHTLSDGTNTITYEEV